MVIVDHLSLAFGPGLTAMTGETGAGKSIVLDCLSFVLGGRGRGPSLRGAAEQGDVTAVFDILPDHPVMAVLEEQGIELDDGALILRRLLKADGRKAGFANDRRVSGAILSEIGRFLVEFQGQGDDHSLMNPAAHRAALDAFGGHEALLAALGQHWRAWRNAMAEHDRLQLAQADAENERAFLEHALAELKELAPEAGDEARLDADRRRMRAAVETSQDLSRAANALENEAEGACANALRWLEKSSAELEQELQPVLSNLERAMLELSETSSALQEVLGALQFDPHELEQTEERLFALRRLARKHNVAPDDLAALNVEFETKLAALGADESALQEFALIAEAARGAYEAAARQLRDARQNAAAKLDKAIANELGPLKMGRAQFATQVNANEPSLHGTETVEFQIATAAGNPPGPLGKVASGGERARFLLALKIALAEAGSQQPLMVFDEIDRGVGGSTADAVGRRLRALSEGGQVLAVTHSPQVAAYAHQHWQVSKTTADGQTLSTVVPLSDGDKISEIARMLSGDQVTDVAKQAAVSLIEQAGKVKL